MYSKFGQFIDGRWQASENKETYEVINPATEEIIGHASKATAEDVVKALKSAQKGFEKWKKTRLIPHNKVTSPDFWLRTSSSSFSASKSRKIKIF